MVSKKIAFGGICTGLIVILLYIASIIPTGKLTVYALSSLPIAFTVVGFGVPVAVIVYAASGILSIFISGNIYATVPFVLFFGHYPILKHYIEKNRGMLVEILLKLGVFNLSIVIAFVFFRGLLLTTLSVTPISTYSVFAILLAAAQVVFFIYDYVFSRLIFYYESRMGFIKKG